MYLVGYTYYNIFILENIFSKLAIGYTFCTKYINCIKSLDLDTNIAYSFSAVVITDLTMYKNYFSTL